MLKNIFEKKLLKEYFPLFLLVLLLIERFHFMTPVTGYNNKFIVIIFIALAAFFLDLYQLSTLKIVFDNIKKQKYLALFYILMFVYFALRGINIFSFTYISTFTMMLMWSFVKIRKESFVFYSVLIVGILLALYDVYVLKRPRSVGLFITSPTIFSMFVTVSCTYILLSKEKWNMIDVGLLTGGFITIVLTKTRTTILLLLVIVIYKLVISGLLKLWIISGLNYIKKNKWLFVVIVVLGLIALFFVLNKLLFRADGHESTRDRSTIMTKTITEILTKPEYWLVGRGPRSAADFTMSLTKGYVITLMHQDILMFMFEYGLIGITFVVGFIKKLKLHPVSILLLLAASFHNGIYNAPLMLIIILLNNALKDKN